MPRFMLTIEYHGAAYAGWQRQREAPSVQQAIEEAIRCLEPAAPPITGAGRTDAGVHALGQVAHCDLTKDWPETQLRKAINYHLSGEAVVITAVRQVSETFSARFSATERHYQYRIICRPSPLALDKGLAWYRTHPLDVAAMQKGAAHLIGHHDFTTFRSVHCQSKSPVKTLDTIEITQKNECITAYLRARSFLHNQVRSIMGTLERVGAGRWQPEDVKRALEAAERSKCGPVAPPEGLYLERVIYPEGLLRSASS